MTFRRDKFGCDGRISQILTSIIINIPFRFFRIKSFMTFPFWLNLAKLRPNLSHVDHRAGRAGRITKHQKLQPAKENIEGLLYLPEQKSM